MLESLKIKNQSESVAVFLHGYGANKEDLYPLGQFLTVKKSLKMDFVFFDAPQSPPELRMFGGRQWFSIHLEDYQKAYQENNLDLLMSRKVEPMNSSLELLKKEVLELRKEYKKVYLGGFSQGSMVGMEYFLRHSEDIDGLFLLSSSLLAYSWDRYESQNGIPIFQSHGKSDQVLKIEMGEKLKEKLESLTSVEYHTFSGGHEIPPKVIEKLGDFLKRESR